MPRTFAGDSRTWWLHGRAVVENANTGDNLSNVLITPQDVTTGGSLDARSAVSGELGPVITNARGETSGAYYLPAPQATLVAPGGDPVVTTTVEIAELVRQFVTFGTRVDDLSTTFSGGISRLDSAVSGLRTDVDQLRSDVAAGGGSGARAATYDSSTYGAGSFG